MNIEECRERLIPAIEVDCFSKQYSVGMFRKKNSAVSQVSFSVDKGEVFGFLGPNGAGKSTTIKALMGFINPDIGTLSILGETAGTVAARKRVGYLPENPYFYDQLTVDEILKFGASTAGMIKSVFEKRAQSLLKKVDLLDVRKKRLRTFSKGMVQRAGLALALIHDPDVIILDEPMSGLDPIGRKSVGDLIVELKTLGKTVFFSSHILNDVERYCDRAAIVVNGKIKSCKTIEDYISSGQSLEDVFMATVAESRSE